MRHFHLELAFIVLAFLAFLNSLAIDRNIAIPDFNDNDIIILNEHKKHFQGLREKTSQEQLIQKDLPPVPLNILNNMTIDKLRDYWDCDEVFSQETRPLYTQQDWTYLRDFYRREGTKVKIAQGFNRNGFIPLFHAGLTTNGKERGIFATRDIKAGEMVYGGKYNYAFFKDGASYRKFLNSMPNHMACDVMQWAWIQSLVNDVYDKLIVLKLDESSFTNQGSGKKDNNIGCPKGMNCKTNPFDDFALHDLKKGEELLKSYGSFAENLWHEFGL